MQISGDVLHDSRINLDGGQLLLDKALKEVKLYDGHGILALQLRQEENDIITKLGYATSLK